MASLRELKKHLASVRMTGQLAGAMKTVSAAKFSRLNAALAGFDRWADACRAMRTRFGASLAEAYPVKNPDAPRCFVLLGANRGLCGGYNIGLYEYADALLAQAGAYRLLVAGKHAAAHAHEQGITPDGEFILPDTAAFDDAKPLLDRALALYAAGEVSSVELVYQRFVNMLTQEPSCCTLLPLSAEGDARDDTLYVPDRATVLRSAADMCVRADFFSRVLEACAGSQAATLIAMRSAFDNAEDSAASLEAVISRRRQSEVTSSVIETAGGNIRTQNNTSEGGSHANKG